MAAMQTQAGANASVLAGGGGQRCILRCDSAAFSLEHAVLSRCSEGGKMQFLDNSAAAAGRFQEAAVLGLLLVHMSCFIGEASLLRSCKMWCPMCRRQAAVSGHFGCGGRHFP